MINFLNQHFSRHLTELTDDPVRDAVRALSSTYAMAEAGKASRLAYGWAIIRPTRSTLRIPLANPNFEYSELTFSQALDAELSTWLAGEPRIFLEFAKKPVDINNVFRSVDPRRVRLCSAAGVQTFNPMTEPPVEVPCLAHVIYWKWKQKQAEAAHG